MIIFLRKNLLLILVLLLGLFLRIYKPLEFLEYGHDQDLAGWIIKDIVVDKHIRLIGQETTSRGLFIGPLFYYLQIPFYLLAGMDPAGSVVLVTLLGAFAILSFYFVFKEVFNKNVGLIASLIYALSFSVIFTDRETVPTMPVMLWSVWFFYGIFKIYQGKQKFYLLIGFLLGLVWHLNLALAVLSPLVGLAQFLSKKKVNTRKVFLGIGIFFVLMSPFLVFEVRHGFIQTKSIVLSLTTNKEQLEGVGVGFAKLDRVIQLVNKNTTRLFFANHSPFPESWFFVFLIALFVLLVKRKTLISPLVAMTALWQLAYIAFFSLNPINVSEYYLNGMNVIWIAIFALWLSTTRFKFLILGIFIIYNVYSYINHTPSKNGYLEKKAIVAAMDADSKKHFYPCISVSYITAPGYDFGYRYFFWQRGMHVNKPSSDAPVYTIVFPPPLVDRVDETFGGLGLVLPDYGRYTENEVEEACRGENSNLTEPMFGYTD